MVLGVSILMLVGLALLVLGVRGRRIDDHPVCRRCRFDLVGVYPGVGTCPECGTVLNEPGRVRIGTRCRGRVAIVLGASALGMGVALGSAVGAGVLGVIELNRYKPVWLLRAEAMRTASPAAAPALGELLRRLEDDEVGRGACRGLVGAALRVQADEARAWLPEWGDLIQTLDTRGLVTAEEMGTYARQAIPVPRVKLQRLARPGDPVPLTPSFKPLRAASQPYRTAIQLRAVTVAGQPARIEPAFMLDTPRATRFGRFIMPDVPPGPAEAVLTWHVRAYGPHQERPIRTIGEWKLNSTGTIDARPRGEETVEVVEDPTLREGFESGLTVQLHAWPGVEGKPDTGRVALFMQDLPMTFACDAIISDGSREWRLGPLVASPTKVRAGHGGPSVPLDGIAPNQEFVTIRLVPSRDAAREFLGVFRIWGGEIIRERVKVQWQHARDSFSAIGAG